MKAKTMSLRAKIRNMATEKGLDPQVLMQNYMLDHFLERVSKSKYSQNFVLKGGLLITSMVGIDNRNTMDMDASIRGIDFNENEIIKIFTEIANIDLGDDITFKIIKTRPIRKEDEYGGIRLTVNANFFSLTQPLKFDFSTGDKITPREIVSEYTTFFDEHTFQVLTYNLETIIAEKLQTIFSRGISTTRMRDYYDIYVLLKVKSTSINYSVLQTALTNTLYKRETPSVMDNTESDLLRFEADDTLNDLWTAFVNDHDFVHNLQFKDTIASIRSILNKLEQSH